MRILFVDDELFFMQPYVDEFQKWADVSVVTTATQAIKEIKRNGEDRTYACLVLDVKMPPPKGWDARTNDGLLTGVEVLRECEDSIAAAVLPVLLLTNHRLGEIQSSVDLLRLPKGLVRVHAKLETPALFAGRIFKELLRKWGPPK